MTAAALDPRIGTTLGPYAIESVIGRGGMGVVYRATDSNLDRRVALKLLSPDIAGDEAFTARFLRESKLAASLDHPNIIPVYDAGRVGDIYYLAMRYVDGADLESRLRSGPLEPRATMSLAAQIGSALDSAAEAGLVHRDVKPANILIASGKAVDREDHAYLTDFGLTKQRGSQTGLTRTGSFLGTLEYVAPEQIEGKPVDGRTDQYALAAIIVECLTGAPLFPRDSDLAIINAQLRDAPPSVHERRPELPIAVDAVLARALAKQPDDRYRDCRSFLEELRSALGVTATQPRPAPGPGTKRGRILGGVTMLAVAMIAIVVLLASNGTFGGTSAASPSGSSVAPPSRPPPSEDASATLGAFPTAAEAALIAALPTEIRETCSRGPERQIRTDNFTTGTPLATILCSPGAAAGANSIQIWQFPFLGLAIGNTGFTTEAAISDLAARYGTRGGDCATQGRVNGRWSLAGEDAGAIVCYIDPPTGDANLWWSYKDASILVRAVNQRGDRQALYDFFDRIARFVVP